MTKIRKYDKQKDEFASVIMHELKTPVSTINGYLQLLQAHLSKKNDKKLLEYADIMEEQVRRLTSLINGLLNVSRIRAVGFEYQEETFEINELITQTVKEVQRTTKSHKIIKENNIIGYIKGDKSRIAQVLINLLTNAIKYSPNATKVLVKLSTNNRKVNICVKDFGVGISKINQKKVFQRFFRIKKSGDSTVFGIGLGLDISAQIIKHHKGKLWIESEEGKGTEFNFTLPLSKI